MMIAYLMNMHPYASCTFIRREITSLEACNYEIARFSIRRPTTKLIDAADLEELAKTRMILDVRAIGLLVNLLWAIVTRPLKVFQALGVAFKIGWHSEKGVLFHLIYLLEACVLLRWLSSLPVVHLHAHFGTNATTVAMLCHLLGGPPYSFTVHGPEEFDKIQGIGLPEKIQRAAFVIAVSSFGRSQLYRWCDYQEWSKIQIVRCGLDRAFREFPGQSIADEPRFVCIGRLSEQKGQFLLVEAVSRLVREGFNFKVVLVGDGPLREAISAAIAQKNLEKFMEITGWMTEDEVKTQILASQVMILPSFAEGLPVVIMESLALGRPVISTYIAGIPELVIPGVSGWLVPPGSVEDLANAMRTAIETPVPQLEKMGKLGAERVARQHNLEKEVQKLADLFKLSLRN